MENCIRSLLIGGEEVEILIIDDGSSDRTAEIADRLKKNIPGSYARSTRSTRDTAEQSTQV